MPTEQLIERMAEAFWNRKANVPWSEFMPSRPEVREFYIEGMRAALALVPPREGSADAH